MGGLWALSNVPVHEDIRLFQQSAVPKIQAHGCNVFY
jgi:hypothetical protein